MNFSAVILAGGRSSRMGCDKARLNVGGRVLLARQIQLAREVGAKEVFIAGRADRDDSEFGCTVLRDRILEAGPLAGIEGALAAMSSLRLLVLAVDMPGLTCGILRRLLEGGADAMGVVPRIDGRIEPLAAIYSKAARSLATALLDSRVRAATTFAERCVQSGMAEFRDLGRHEAHCFASWNTPADVNAGVAHQSSRLSVPFQPA